MTEAEAIARLDLLLPNSLPDALKQDWLAALDGWILRILPPLPPSCAHETGLLSSRYGGGVRTEPSETPGEQPPEGSEVSPVLLVPDPAAHEIYVNYLLSKAALSLGEPELCSLYYNAFYTALNRFAAAANRGACRPVRPYRF